MRQQFGETLQDIPILTLGGLIGRFDHLMGSLNVLYVYHDLKIILFTESSMTFLLNKGNHELDCSAHVGYTCGLIPLSGPVTLTTRGLFWDLETYVTEFGRLVSTSNLIKEPSVSIMTDGPILWTMEINHP